MSIRNLNALLRPQSIAVIGASREAHSVGATVLANLLDGGFAGPIMPVNPKYDSIAGVLAYPSVAALPAVPDLAIICTPPATIPQLIGELAGRGTKAAIVLTAGIDAAAQNAMLAAARPHLLRILGPNCLGLIVPGIGLNASFAHTGAAAGKIAFVSQSGALATAILDWALGQGIGFSHFVSLGNGADVDFGDMLDLLGSEPSVHAILLYVEAVTAARKFMSAARAAARNKPVIIVKAGRVSEGARAAHSHTGALAGSDDVYDAAIRRAGMLRVNTIEELFNAAETLARCKPLRGERLMIVTNGGGPGVLATDALAGQGGVLAELSPATRARLDRVLPATWSRDNPIDLIGDASIERHLDSFKILFATAEQDAFLFMHSPTAIVERDRLARALAPIFVAADKPILSCWLGGGGAAQARRIFNDAGLATFDTPEDAVNAFLQVVHYRRNQDILMETPPSTPDVVPDMERARNALADALGSGREWLSEIEIADLLGAYHIPMVPTRFADTADKAAAVADELGYPVALKIVSPDVTHKSDVGGVSLNLNSAPDVTAAATAMARRVGEIKPQARLAGFSVQPMIRRPNAHELIVGASEDAVFGPVLLFGHGGTAVEVIADKALALPPLNAALARELVERTRVAKLLAGYRNRPAADLVGIYDTLTRISQMIADLAEIVELDINPLLADETGVLALDARVRVRPAAVSGAERLAIRPYPRELEQPVPFGGGSMLLRPIRPDDEPHHRDFFAALAPGDVRFRFFGQIKELSHSQMARYCQIDYDREMAFIATPIDGAGKDGILGVVRAICDPDNVEAEFALIVRSDRKGKGLGTALLDKMIRYCRARRTQRLVGEVLAGNAAMLTLARELGFTATKSAEPGAVRVVLDLAPPH